MNYDINKCFRISNINIYLVILFIIPPPLKRRAYCVAHVCLSVGPSVRPSVGMSVALNLVQLITREHIAPETSNL